MTLPAYTELSNFTTRKDGKKIKADLSVVLIITHLADPVNTINSIYSFASSVDFKAEVLIINMEKEGYKYDRLLSDFPALRVLLPRITIGYHQAIEMAVQECLSKNILFLDENIKIKNLDIALIKPYLTQSSFGAIVPQIVDEHEDIIPNIIKASVKDGFLDTISMDLKGASLTTLYPKYVCFILNRDIFRERNIQLGSYDSKQYNLLDLGYKIWREGFTILQANYFKVKYLGNTSMDISFDAENNDYLLFNYRNINDKELTKRRNRKTYRLLISSLFTLRIPRFRRILYCKKEEKLYKKTADNYPVSDKALFAAVNQDFE